MNREQRRAASKIERSINKKENKKAKACNYIRCLVSANYGFKKGDLFTTSADGHNQVFMAVIE